VLSPESAGAAISVALDVAGRLRDLACVAAALAAAADQTAFPESIHWEPYGVAQGDAGLAVLCGYLDACFPDQGWDVTGHELLAGGVLAAGWSGQIPPGIFGGTSGLAFAAWSLSRNGTRYRRLLASLEDSLASQAVQLSRTLVRQDTGVAVSHFDLISGLTGIGAYMLCRREQPGIQEALDALLGSLIALTRPRSGIPRWYTPPGFMLDESMARRYPYGNLNCGLAHGIPGPLALMALAYQTEITVPGLAEAIGCIANWLITNRADDGWGINWPTAVPVNGSERPCTTCEPSRSAWCYGSPGVARALWLAGQALGDTDLHRLAIEAMEAVFRRPIPERRIDSPTFCHGIAGLLQITLRFAIDTGLPVFFRAAQTLTDQLLRMYDPDRLLGFPSVEPGGNRVDQAGLLDGAPGVVMTLLAAGTGVNPSWDRLFMLS
jgi:hypothetical protein